MTAILNDRQTRMQTEDWNGLQQISMVTANFNDGLMIEDVLNDWFQFLGGKPAEVIVVDGGSDQATQNVYWSLFQKGLIDKLQVIRPDHSDNNKDTCYIQEYTAGFLASNPYILWFKIDTLPYREGHETWLKDALGYLQREDVFAVSGALNRSWDTWPAWDGYYFCNACTINFALMKRSTFVAAMQEMAGEFIQSGFQGEHPYGRMLLEASFIEYMQRHNQYTLCKLEDPSWTVFHTNAHDQHLKRTRAQFHARQNLEPYMNPALAEDVTQFLYYGYPPIRAGFWQQLKIRFGQTALGAYWRQFKLALQRQPKRS